MSGRKIDNSVQSILLALLVMFAGGDATARDVAGTWGAGFEGGTMKLVEGRHDYGNLDQFFGLNVERGLAYGWELRLGYQYGLVRPGVGFPDHDAGWSFETGAPYYTTISHPSLGLLYRFFRERSLTPRAGLAMGLTSWKVLDLRGQDVGLFPGGDPVQGYDIHGDPAALEGTDFAMTVEAGLDLFLSEQLALNLGARMNWTPTNDLDNVGTSALWGPRHVDANTGRVDVYAGLTWWFGSNDSDGDGLANDEDLCPEYAEDFDGFNDLDGCPDPDNDGDRIVDERDLCPDEPEDFDGYQDEDGCPEPDNDQDGVFDNIDRCPEEAEDLDGFQDEDGCPDPDNDMDGVLDAQDQCPGTPRGTRVDENGCPVVAEIKQDLILEGVTFRSGSADLTPESMYVLKDVAESLLAWPAVRVEIRGHTDSTGSDETNRDLSHRRALAVKDALISLGVAPGRLEAIGYGEDYPLADNGTPKGRRINRRVEMHKLD